MVALVKYKHPTEYSFYIWIRNHPESTHWTDRGRFLKFVKSVCKFNAKRWKDSNYLEERILQEKPKFDKDRLRDILVAYEYLIDFYKAGAQSWDIENIKVKPNHYIERGIKGGKFYEKQLSRED